MNKIFKIIWSKARNCYVVVSELAKSHDDGHVRRSRSGCCRKAAILAAFVLTMSLAVVPVWAADSNGNITNNDASTMTGSNTTNQSKNSVIYGSGNAVDDSENTVVVGKDNKAKTSSVVIGNGAQSNATDQIVIGKGKANGDAIGSIVIGNSEAIANTSQSVIIGNYAKANGSGQGVIVMGNGAMADDYAAGYNDNGKYIPAGIVLGEYSYSNTRAGKVGYLNDKKGSKPSSAFTDEYWNAVWTATANPMAIGNADTDASGKGEGHNGHGVLTRQITGVAAGTDLTDAVNVAQLQAAIAQFSGGGSGISGDGVHYYSVSSNEQGPDSNYDNKGATGANALAAGVSASATGAHSVAVGNGATAKGQDSIALGTGAVADGIGATAIGQYNTASGQNSLAFGEKSTASGEASTAFGIGSTAAAKNSLAALGGTVAESVENAAAIGKNAQATLADSVALGSNSVTTRAKYSDLTDEEKKAVYIKGDSTGSAWEATDNAIAVGNDSKVTRQITGVAAGSLDTDAVNVAQLKKVQNLAGKHTKVTVEGGTAAGTADYAGENLKLKVKDDNGQKTYDLKLSDKLSVGGKDGQDGHIGVNGQDGKSGVGIDGKDGISIKGKDGNDGVTIKGIDGKDGVNGAEGHIGLNGKDGMTDIWTKPGTPGLNGKDGETMTRIVYKDPSGQEHEAATLDDGLKFGGDFGNASAVKLDKQVNVKGNAKKETDLTDGNIGVVSSQDGENGQLLVKLNKDLNLGNNGSVTMGNTTIDNGGVTIKNSAADTTKNVSLTNAGLDNGGNKITNVAAGEISATSTDAVNGSQLNTVKTLAGKHTEVTVEGGTAAGTADYAGENLKLKVKDDNGQKTYDLKLSDKLSVGGKDGQDGHIGVNGQDGKSGVGIDGKDGISIKGKDGNDGVTIKGIDGKDGVNGAEGHIGLNGKDGMTDIWTKPGTPGLNGKDGETMTRIVYKDPSGQEHEAATLDDGLKFGGDFGNASAVKLDKQVNVKGNAKKETDLTDGNIGVVSSQDGENGQLLIKLNKDLNLGNNGSVKMGNTTINNAGVTIQPSAGDATKSVSLTNKGLDNGGNKITNVAAGEISDTSTDAVNGSQLNTVKNLAEQHTTVEAGPSGNVTVTPGTNADGSKKYTVDLAKDVTFGDAAKGDNTVAISGTNGTITAGTGDNKITVDGSRGQIVAGGNNGVKIGNIENGDRSLTIYDKDGKATDKKADGGQFVTNLDNKTWNTDGSYVSGRAATEDQLHQVESNVNKKFDDVNTKIESVDKHHTEVTVNGGTAAKADGSYTDGNLQIAQKTGSDGQKIYDLKLSDNLNIGGVGKDGKDGKDGHMGINGADGKSGVGIDGKDGISIKGKDGQNGVTIKGVDGKDGTEGHIGLTGPKGADGQNATADIHVQNGQNGVDGTDGHGGKDGMDRVVYEDHNHITHEVATMDDGMKYSGDSGNAAVKLNKNVQIYGGATEYADGNNIGVVASQDGDNAKLQVKLAKDIKGINSIEAKTITTGDTTINNSGLTVKGDDNHKAITIHQDNVNMGGNKVSGVADGKVSKNSTDAVNGSQLWQRDQAINGLSGSVNKLGNRINRVGAGAAALAALHPLDFDPDDKWDFAAGYGNYRGANAAAIGAYYRPNEDTMFSVGGSFGGGENMVNAGVSIKLGQGNHVSTSRVAMAKEMKAMRQHMAEQDALIAKLQSMHGMAVDPAKSVLFPDVAENHWAYQYVTTLAKKGILEGYPDGEFKGDRMMTRYEFAAIVYRIVENGVGSTDPELSKLVKEFSPELQYIRIDTIQKDRNGKPTIERVRVISDAK